MVFFILKKGRDLPVGVPQAGQRRDILLARRERLPASPQLPARLPRRHGPTQPAEPILPAVYLPADFAVRFHHFKQVIQKLLQEAVE